LKIYEEEYKKSVSKVSALNALGMIYETGKHVSKDLKKALRFYKEG
jgi:TPR repeat protein